jgi:hypothetical protein
VLTLIRKARRRVLYNELLSQAVTAVCAALAAFILLLILGTEILNWYWVVFIPVATFAGAAYRLRKRIPPLYVAAQIVDRRMGLADSLSTAVYFSEEHAWKPPAGICRRQFEQAERAALGIDPRRAIPYTMPRSAYAMAALILVASSLFALRYGLSRRLDLAEPMARILQQALGLDAPQTASTPQRKNIRPGEFPQDDNDSPLEAQKPADDQNQPGDPLDDGDQQPQSKSSEKDGKEQQAKSDQQNGDQQGQGQEQTSDQENPDRPSNSKDAQNQQSNGQESNSSSSSSLMSKMRDALQNLLSSMKQQNNNAGQQQSQQQQNSAQNSKQKGQQNANKQQKGEKTNGQSGGEEQDPDLNNESQQAENSPGQGTDSQPSNKQPGGGIGNRDGAKDLKQAEQLAAMGKISQIIGKRSQNLSGEATIEVQSTVQQLRTAYADRSAQHADSGGEIGRDEIPAALESYVEQYFEQVRKQPAPKK